MAELGFGLGVSRTGQDVGFDLYSTSFSEKMGALAADAWNFSPLNSSFTFYDLGMARERSELTEQPLISRDQLNKEYGNLGLHFEQDEYQSVVDIMVEKKQAEIERNSIIQRGPTGVVPTVAGFATQLATSVVDPINLASAFIPVFGQARFARLAGQYGFGKARFIRGTVEGAVGATLVEPIVYAAAEQVQADYTAMDSFLNISFGTLIGGGLHVGAGKLKDLNTARKFRKRVDQARAEGKLIDGQEPELNLYREYYPEHGHFMRALERTHPHTRQMLLNKSLNDVLTEKPVDVSPITSNDPVLKNTTETSAAPEVRPKATTPDNQNVVSEVEADVKEKGMTEMQQDMDNLIARLNDLRVRQIDQKIDMEAEVKQATDELDQFNAQETEINAAIKDAINCQNGR